MSDLNKFPIHQGCSTSLTLNLDSIHLIYLVLGLIQVAFLGLARKAISRYFSSSSRLSHLPQIFNSGTSHRHVENSETLLQKSKNITTTGVCRQDMEVVLRSLGMVSNNGASEASRLPSRVDSDDLIAMFEERNPEKDEVREAFEVFDKNKDEFIDAEDLQKVMSGLGLEQGLENCRRMIGVFDENEDGRLDFQEFVNFMEKTFI